MRERRRTRKYTAPNPADGIDRAGNWAKLNGHSRQFGGRPISLRKFPDKRNSFPDTAIKIPCSLNREIVGKALILRMKSARRARLRG